MLCVHYFVTYEPSLPHGCNLFGFKSKQLPTVAVFQETGDHCANLVMRPERP